MELQINVVTDHQLDLLSWGGGLLFFSGSSLSIPLLVDVLDGNCVLGVELVLGSGHGGGLGLFVDSLPGENIGVGVLGLVGGSGVGVGDGSVCLLMWLSGGGWDDNQLALVSVESSDVLLESLSRSILSSTVDDDADGLGELWGDTGLLELIERESLSDSWLARVSGGGRGNDGSQFLDWPWEDGGGLGSSGFQPPSLLSWLVEVGLNPSLPVLSKVDVREDVVVLWHLIKIDLL